LRIFVDGYAHFVSNTRMDGTMMRGYGSILAVITLLTAMIACSSNESGDVPIAEPEAVPIKDTSVPMSLSIAVLSLDAQGWDDVHAFLLGIPAASEAYVFYDNGRAFVGNRAAIIALLDSLNATQTLQPSNTPPTLPYFSSALSAAISRSLRSDGPHIRTVILGTFPPLGLRSNNELRRVGPIITKTELEALSNMPDHQFILIGPSADSPLRTMLLRAFSEARSTFTTMSYSDGVAK